MDLLKTDLLAIKTENDIFYARKKVREWSLEIGFGIVDQTKLVTVCSELARNTLNYGHGGEMEISVLKNEKGKPGIRLIFKDQGPGIFDVGLAMTDGYTTGGGLGLGLSGSKRLVSEFHLETEIGKGTCVTVIKWK